MSDERLEERLDDPNYDPGTEPLPRSSVSDNTEAEDREIARLFQQPQQQPEEQGAVPVAAPAALPAVAPQAPVPQQQQPQQALLLQQPLTGQPPLQQPLTGRPASFYDVTPPRQPPAAAQKRDRAYRSGDRDYTVIGEPSPVADAVGAQPPSAGLLDIIFRGGLRGTEDLKQSGQVVAGKKPTASETKEEEYEKPLELTDFGSPALAAKKALFGFARAYPTIAASIAGGVAGGMAGGAIGGTAGTVVPGPGNVVGGGIGATIGAIGGASAAAGLMAGFQELGPAVHGELQALGANPSQQDIDAAYERARVTVIKSGLISAASMALFAGNKPLGNFAKGFFAKPFLAAGAKAAPIGVRGTIALQGVGQEAIAVGGQVAGNVAQGRPWDEGTSQAAAGGLLNVGIDAAGRLGAAGVRRMMGRPPESPPPPPPTTPINPDVELALRTQQNQALPVGRVDPNAPTGGAPPDRNAPRVDPNAPTGGVPPPPPGGGGGGGVPPRLDPNAPGGGIGILPNAPRIDPNAPVMPRLAGSGGQMGVTPPDINFPTPRALDIGGAPRMDPNAPVGGAGIPRVDPNAPQPAPTNIAPVDPNAPGGVRGPGFTMGPAPETILPRTTQEFRPRVDPNAPPAPRLSGSGALMRKEPPILPEEGGGLPPPPSGPPPILPTVAPPTRAPRLQQRLTTEPDDIHKGKWVAKDGPNVVGKGETAEAAIANAKSRRGRPYPPEPGETAAAKAGTVEPLTPEKYLDDYLHGRGRDSPEHEQFAAAIEEALQRKKAAEDDAATANKKAAIREQVAKIKAEAAAKKAKAEPAPKPPEPPARDVTQEVRELMLTDKEDAIQASAYDEFTKRTTSTLDEQKVSQIRRHNELERRQGAWAAGFDAGLREQPTAPQYQAKNLISSFREGRAVGRRIREERAAETVTKPSTEKAAPEPAPAEPKVTIDSKPAEEGMQTTTGAYSMGEGKELSPETPRQPPTSTLRPSQRTMAAGARQEMQDQPLHIEGGAKAPFSVRPIPREFTLPPGESKIRHGWRLITALLKREPGLTLTQANQMYGSKELGTHGRPRKYATLADVAREALRRAENPKLEIEIRQKMKTLEGKGKVDNAAYKELNVQVELLEAARLNKAQLKAYVEHLDTFKLSEPIESRVPGIEGRIRELVAKVERDAVVDRASRSEVNDPLLEKLESVGHLGANGLHELLDIVINNNVIHQLAPQLSVLARTLRETMPDMVVGSRNDIVGRNGTPIPAHFIDTSRTGGRIEMNIANLRTNPNAHAVQILLHEALHGGTYKYIRHLFATPEVNLNPRELAHKTALREIAVEIDRLHGFLGKSLPLTYNEKWFLKYATRAYEAGDLQEIITGVFTQPEVSAVLGQTKASTQLKSVLDRVGLGGRGVSTIWDGFKRVIRDVFGLRRAEHSDSVLDVVLRPLTEIVETGVKYRAEVLKARNDSIIGSAQALGPPEGRYASSMKTLKSVMTSAADKGNVVLRAALRTGMHGLNMYAIHDFIKPYVPSVTAHVDALDKVAFVSAQERIRKVITHDINGQAVEEANVDKAMRLVKNLNEHPNTDDINKLMTNVTLADMSVLDPRKNAHLVTKEQLEEQRGYQRTFDALDDRGQHIYREINEYHNLIHQAEREAAVKDYVEQAFPDMTPAEREVIQQQMRTRQGVMDVFERPDTTPVARMMGKRWETGQDLVRLIAEQERTGFINGDYFPARRFGEYVVRAGVENTPSYLVQMFETASSAHTFKKALEQGGRDDVSQVFIKSKQTSRDMVGQAALSTLDRAMERAGLTLEQQQVLKDKYAGQMIQQGTRMATRTMRREGIAGASVEQSRALLSDFLAYTTRMGHLTHGSEAARTMYQMEADARAMHGVASGPRRQIGVDADGNPVYERLRQATEAQVAIAQAGAYEFRRRMAPVDGDYSPDLMGKGVRGLTTWTALATLVRPAHYFMNLAGTYTAATSLIAARHGVGAIGEVAKAFAQLSGSATRAAGRNAMAALHGEMRAANFDMTEVYRNRLKNLSDLDPAHANLLIDRMNQLSLINNTFIKEIQNLARPFGFGDGRFNFISRFLDVSAAGEHALDSMMRVGTAKAAFVAELRKNGGNLQGALDYAMQMARDSQPVYGHNKSRLATSQGIVGRFAPLVTQFKQFGLHMYGVQGNLLAKAFREASTPLEKREAWKALAYLHASHAVLWGGVASSVFGSLPVMFGLGLFDALNPTDPSKRPHTAREWEAQSRNWAYDMTQSKTFATMFAHGVPAGFGADTHRSLQFTNLLGVPEYRTFDKDGALNFMIQVLTGASGDTAAGLMDNASRLIKGDIRQETVAKLMPRIVRDPWEAYIWGSEGLKTGKGQLIVPPGQFSPSDLALKAAGFIPSTASTGRDARSVIDLAQHVEKDVKASLTNRLIEADPADRGKVFMEIVRHNQSVPADERISMQSIKSRLREQQTAILRPEFYGMHVPVTDTQSMRERVRYATPS